MTRSRIPHFYKMSVAERVRAVRDRGLLSDTDFDLLSAGQATLDLQAADKMIENVIGVLGMPVGLGLNFLINGKDYVVPHGGRGAVHRGRHQRHRQAGPGVRRLRHQLDGAGADRPDPGAGAARPAAGPGRRARAQAGDPRPRQQLPPAHGGPRRRRRGPGGALLPPALHARRRCWWCTCSWTPATPWAPTWSTACARAWPRSSSSSPRARSSCASSPTWPTGRWRAPRSRCRSRHLAGKGYAGERVRDGVIIAADFADADPYRAATHNKGIMNGVDAVALATGNDWRAIEAGAHAYAARHGRYSSLTEWWKDDAGNLRGSIEMPHEGRHRRRAAGVEPRRGDEPAPARRRSPPPNWPRSWRPWAWRRTSRRCGRSPPTASRPAT